MNMIAMSDEYYRVCVEAWADEVARRHGPDLMARDPVGGMADHRLATATADARGVDGDPGLPAPRRWSQR